MRALVVSYAFPPTGGAGVGRPLKLVKYLGHHGVQATVLTVANPSTPTRDETLLRDVPASVPVIKTRTWEPGYGVKQAGWDAGQKEAGKTPGIKKRLLRTGVALGRQVLVPDPQILWQPLAQVALARRLVAGLDDVVFITAPPFSSFLLAPLARLRPKVGVVLDYRDEWSTVREVYEMSGQLQARAGAALEAVLVRTAHVITTATAAFRTNLLQRFPFLHPDRVFAIPNGYDPDDFPPSLAGPPPGSAKLLVVYAGTLFRLTSARGFLGAVRRLHREHPALAQRLEVRFLGRIVETERDAFAGMEALGVRQVGYVSHDEVVTALGTSHLNLCILDEAPGIERIFPGKIFELMHLVARHGRPCLTLSPEGVLADLVREHHLGTLLPPRDEVAIAAHLEMLLREFVAGKTPQPAVPTAVHRFSRQNLAGEFAAAMRVAHHAAKA